MSKGVIYILTNPAFDEYVKIGYASNLENRLKTLNNSSALPYAFRVYAVSMRSTANLLIRNSISSSTHSILISGP